MRGIDFMQMSSSRVWHISDLSQSSVIKGHVYRSDSKA